MNNYSTGGDEIDNKSTACDCLAIHGEILEKVKRMMPPDNDFYDVANLYKMFADSTRAKILWALHCSEMCVCDLAVLLNMSKSAISHQLKSLRMAKLVRYEKQGKVVLYSLADNHIHDIFEKGFEHIHE